MATASPTDLISNWSTLIENLETSPLGFFESVEAAVKKRAIPDIESTRVDYHESGIVSAKREYLRITRGNLIFDVCAAPYGTGFFVSWWLGTPMVQPMDVIGLLFGYFMAVLIFIAALGLWVGLLAAIGLVMAACWFGAEGRFPDKYLLVVPLVGYIYRRFFKPHTLYAIDTATMFQTATHAAVLEAVDGLMTAKGLRLLSESERKPILQSSIRK